MFHIIRFWEVLQLHGLRISPRFLSEFRNLWVSFMIFDYAYLLTTSYPKKEITKLGVCGFKLSIFRIVFVRYPTCTFPEKIVLAEVFVV